MAAGPELPGNSGRLGRSAAPGGSLEPGFYRMIKGKDTHDNPHLLTTGEVAKLNDPVVRLVLGRGTLPLTVIDLLKAIAAHDGTAEGLPEQRTYLVGEGGQLPLDLEVERNLRFVITRSKKPAQPNGPLSEADLMISTSVTEPSAFLQVIGWDPVAGVYNFYERLKQSWFWAGNSDHALRPPTRGQIESPFDSHVNGTLVMKEFKFPWLHWHSPRAEGPFPPELMNDNVLEGTEFAPTEIADARQMEINVVKPGVARSVTERLARVAQDSDVQEAPLLLRHLIEGTTVNLVSSTKKSTEIKASDTVPIPISFFLASDLFADLGLEVTASLEARGVDYLAALSEHQVALQAPDFRLEGDTFFAFVVPERAFEDDQVIREMLSKSWLTPRFVACILMVDFPNSLFSRRRASLMRFVSNELPIEEDGGITGPIVEAILNEGRERPSSAAGDFAANWNLGPDAWQANFAEQIRAYVAALNERLATREGYLDIFRLAESRRREFSKQPLREFDLTLPTSNIDPDSPRLEMTEDAVIRPRNDS